jgi:hypothetical protein
MTSTEAARGAVQRIIEDLTRRRGLRQEWDDIDEGIQQQIREGWEGIVEDAIDEYVDMIPER